MDDGVPLSIDMLRELYKHYATESKDYLDLTYKYLNFYMGLNSALLAATLAGLLNLERGDKRGLLLTTGPLLVIGLTTLGFLTIRVFYRRFVEARLTMLNIQRMLKLSNPTAFEDGIQEPPLKSRTGGFVAQFERVKMRTILAEAEHSGDSLETVVERTTAKGDTLRYAAATFVLFGTAAMVFLTASLLLSIS